MQEMRRARLMNGQGAWSTSKALQPNTAHKKKEPLAEAKGSF